MEILLVSVPGCHFCRDARGVLIEFASEFGFELREIDARSAEGGGVVELYRPAMWPVVLVDGRPFSFGRLPAIKLRRLLEHADMVA